ncbi:MAG TPA: hypothetical protein VG821_12235 [Rhizomicrobium sp.]|nr:hypothetical protein [Rhizomicrobium sp.]
MTFRGALKTVDPRAGAGRPGLLIVAGWAMNAEWCQLWAMLGAVYQARGQQVYALTTRQQPIQNLYFRLFGIALLYLEDIDFRGAEVPVDIRRQIDALAAFDDVKAFEIDGVPFGKMALSTYTRQRATGIMDIADEKARQEVRRWLIYLYQVFVTARIYYQSRGIGMTFFTEVFMEEYGSLYYAALKDGLNIVRFAGTVRDDAVVVQHLTPESDRTHFSSISEASWARILPIRDLAMVREGVEQNFRDRYGDKWGLSARNQPNTRIVPVAEARAALGVPEGRKIAVAYSHILYDTLFFNGEDIFQNYADWLVRTVKAACANPAIDWFIKVHPSNLWRGELEYYHGGKYEEVRLIEEHIGVLPPHVRLVYPDTPFSPYTWLELADVGITVRGTSGIELGALGKTVVTAGTGRYESAGFSINPQTVEEYLDVLAALPDIPAPDAEQRRRGLLFAYATFCMKPFTLDFLVPVTRTGKKRIFSSDDLVFLGSPSLGAGVPASIEAFVEWSYRAQEIDFLSCWPAQAAADAN